MSKFDKDIPDAVSSRFTGLVDAAQSGWFNQDADELFHGYSITSDDVVLDFGCGEGGASLFCGQRGAHLVLVDVEEVALVKLAARLREKTSAREIETVVSNTVPLPLPGEYASKIVCMEVLEHVEEPPDLLAELVRLGRPGAQYLLSVPGAKGEVMQQGVAPESYFEAPNHLHIFESDEFIALVEDSGLIIENCSQSGFFWVMWMNIYWANEAAKGNSLTGAIRDKIVPPFDSSLDQWASLWLKLISTPQGREFKVQMDSLLPKNQVIVARKPT